MQTVLKEVEAVVDSRPLVYIGEDINASISITPNNSSKFQTLREYCKTTFTNIDKERSPFKLLLDIMAK